MCFFVLLMCTLLVSVLGARMESATVPNPKVFCGADKMRKRPGVGRVLGVMFSLQTKRLEISLCLK